MSHSKNLPVRIECTNGSELLEHEIAGPPGSKFPIVRESAIALIVTCELLNPGEVFVVGFTVADASDGTIHVTARDENLVCKISGPGTNDALESLVPNAFIRALVKAAWGIYG